MLPISLFLTPLEFEKLVAEHLTTIPHEIRSFNVSHSKNIVGSDGTYEIDVLVTFRILGLNYRTLVECKHHKASIKRDVVQVLQSRLQSTGSQKGAIVSISGFQKGAIEFAQSHGIALIQISDNRMYYIIQSAEHGPPPSWLLSIVRWRPSVSNKGKITLSAIQLGGNWFSVE